MGLIKRLAANPGIKGLLALPDSVADIVAAPTSQKIKLSETFHLIEIGIPRPPDFLEFIPPAFSDLKTIHYDIHALLLTMSD